MTGISFPYDTAVNLHVEVVTDGQSIEESVQFILKFLNQKLKINI